MLDGLIIAAAIAAIIATLIAAAEFGWKVWQRVSHRKRR